LRVRAAPGAFPVKSSGTQEVWDKINDFFAGLKEGA
jgi:hypothetical protein